MARSQGDFSLVGCTVAPGFEFEHFEMAPEGFEPLNLLGFEAARQGLAHRVVLTTRPRRAHGPAIKTVRERRS